jgi:GT2 family glycosyltransferase
VSVIVSTYNRAHCIRALLQHLIQLLNAELDGGTAEILVFDDASTDETAAACARYNSQVRYLSSPRHVGYIEARRQLMGEATGEYVVQVDDDSCLLDADALDRVREAFARHPECGLITANVASPNVPSGYAAEDAEPITVASFIGCGCAFRAGMIRALGSYPAFLDGYGAEEIALSLLAWDRGYQVLFLPSFRVFHLLAATQRPLGTRRGMAYLNEAATILALYPAWLVVPSLAYKTASYLVYNARQRSLRAFLLAQTGLPSRLARAARARHAVRYKTIRKYYALRAVLDGVRAAHGQRCTPGDSWPDIAGIFPTVL